ncbi:MAG: TonB-dependent receptor [Psychrobium sp.]|nr:TonB-dependent receptor [Psychrobium sp.]
MKLSILTIAIIGTFSASAISAEHASKKNSIKKDSIERITITYKRSNITAHITEDAEKLVDMPGAMGDPLQAIFALPGVVAAGGSMSAPAVRGSSPQDNMYEVDFMPAGYIFHDFGSSIFNRHLIQDFQLISAGYGTGYSNATGAVFDVSLRTPRHQDIKTTIDFSFFNTGFFVEGEVSEDSAFYLSGRKSNLPLFFNTGEEIEDDDGELTGVTVNDAPDDYDIQGKYTWDVDANNVLSFSFTKAHDSAGANFNQRAEIALKSPEFQGDAVFKRSFNSQNLLWDHYAKNYQLKFGLGVLNSEEVLSYGRQQGKTGGYFMNQNSTQYTVKARLNYAIDEKNQLIIDAAYFDLKSNFYYDTFQYICTESDPDCDVNKREQITGQVSADLDSYFIGANYVTNLTDAIQTEFGVQWQHSKYSDEAFFLPRLALNYFVSNESTISLKYGGYNRQQDLGHILPEIGNEKLKSQTAKHTTIGFVQELSDEWSWSIEAYYKVMDDLPLALDENQPDANSLYSNDMVGKAYGLDFLLNKNKTDNWYGWVSLSYAKSERTNERTNVTRDYYADTPIVFNAVYQYQMSERWSGGFNLTARSGQAYTPIVGVRENSEFAGRFLPIYGEAFSKRHDLYHRLDVRFERKTDFFGLDAKLVFEVMNVLAVSNISGIDLDYQKVKSTNDLIIAEDDDDFGMRPSVGFSVTF